MRGIAIFALAFAGFSVDPAFAAGDQTAVEQIPPAVLSSMRSGVFIERSISDRLAPLREADMDRDGLDAGDLDRQKQRVAAQGHLYRLGTIFINDANGDGRVTRDEVRAAATLLRPGEIEVNQKSVDGHSRTGDEGRPQQ